MYKYKMIERRRDKKKIRDLKSDSIKLEVVKVSDERRAQIKIDMNVKSNNIIEVEFSNMLCMYTFSVYTALADKIAVVSSKNVYRRIKDIYDLLVYTNLYTLEYAKVMEALRRKHDNIVLKNMLTPANMIELKHAYDKFSGIANKPEFDYTIGICQSFLYPIYRGNNRNLIWSNKLLRWVEA